MRPEVKNVCRVVVAADGNYRLTQEDRQKAFDKLNAEKRSFEEKHGISLSEVKRKYRLFEEISRNWN